MENNVWTVSEAKARLSEVLRCAATEGPQVIGTRNRYVVVPEHLWQQPPQPQPLGEWLLENFVGIGVDLELPDRKEKSKRPIPFEGEGW